MRHWMIVGLGFFVSISSNAMGKDRPYSFEVESSIAPEARGNEALRSIRRYLECKGRHCESWYPEAFEAVEKRSDDFKLVWDTLAREDRPITLADKSKRKKKMRKTLGS